MVMGSCELLKACGQDLFVYRTGTSKLEDETSTQAGRRDVVAGGSWNSSIRIEEQPPNNNQRMERKHTCQEIYVAYSFPIAMSE